MEPSSAEDPLWRKLGTDRHRIRASANGAAEGMQGE